MDLSEEAWMLRIYLGESDKHAGKPLYKHVVHLLRERGVWGATAVRGVYGFGKKSVLHTASPLRLSEDLPIVIEAVDAKRKIEAVAADVARLVREGLVVTFPVRVVTQVE